MFRLLLHVLVLLLVHYVPVHHVLVLVLHVLILRAIHLVLLILHLLVVQRLDLELNRDASGIPKYGSM